MCFYRSILKRRWTHKIKTSYSYNCDKNRFDDMNLKVNNVILISPSSRTFHRQISQPYFTSVRHIIIRIFLFFHYYLRFSFVRWRDIHQIHRPWRRSKHLPDEILKQRQLCLINLVHTKYDSLQMLLKYTMYSVIFMEASCIYSLVWDTTTFPQSIDPRFARC